MGTIPKTHCFIEEDLHLFELPQIYTASSIWHESGMNYLATFDLLIRDMPKNRNFLIMGGTEEIIKGILNWKYSKEEVEYLLKNNIITPKFAKYLKNFRFSGDVYALPEGTIFFPGGPVIRITAPIVEANILTMFLINALTSNTIFTSKVVRGVLAAKDKLFVAAACQRAQSNESAFKFGRAVYMLGGAANMIPSFCRKYNLPYIPASRKAYHAVIKSFPTEIEAMRKTVEIFPNMMDFMVDTYNFEKGVQNTITVAKEIKKDGNSIKGITIDSGDLYIRSIKARNMLDKTGLKEITITVAGNLDEWKIKELMDKKAPIDKFIVVTEMIASNDAPSLEAVYKLAEIIKGKKIIPKAKFAHGKESYPGKKQIFRILKNKKMVKDIIGLENEKLGKALLVKMINKGQLISKLPSLDKIQEHINKELKQLPSRLLDIENTHNYKVEISKKVMNIMLSLKQRHF